MIQRASEAVDHVITSMARIPMKVRLSLIVLFVIAPLTTAVAQDPQQSAPPVSHSSERKAVPGPAVNFTGRVIVEPIVNHGPPGRAVLGLVTFASGARSNWHGATDTTAMTHLSIGETLRCRNVDWAEPVTDAQSPMASNGRSLPSSRRAR